MIYKKKYLLGHLLFYWPQDSAAHVTVFLFSSLSQCGQCNSFERIISVSMAWRCFCYICAKKFFGGGWVIVLSFFGIIYGMIMAWIMNGVVPRIFKFVTKFSGSLFEDPELNYTRA